MRRPVRSSRSIRAGVMPMPSRQRPQCGRSPMLSRTTDEAPEARRALPRSGVQVHAGRDLAEDFERSSEIVTDSGFGAALPVRQDDLARVRHRRKGKVLDQRTVQPGHRDRGL